MPAQAIPDFNDHELTVLNAIGEAESMGGRLTQRELAGRAGISLGLANNLLKRLAERGWVKLTRVSPKSVRYALTITGVGELAQRTAGYFNRASRSAELYRDRLEALIINSKRMGKGTIVLFGASEVEPVLAYVCERHGLVFVKTADIDKARQLARKSGGLLLIAEKESVQPEACPDGAIPSGREESLAVVLAGMQQP